MPSLEMPVISLPLIGRTTETETLVRALQAARQGTGQSFLISGEAGVGKSRLLAELRRQAEVDGFIVLQGHCFEPDLAYPYAPLIDALRTYFVAMPPAEVANALGPMAAELVKLLPELSLILPDIQPTPALDPESEKRRLFAGLAHFLTALATLQPLLFILEDVHWADETSLEFLHFFARQLAALPILLVTSFRREEMTLHLAQTVALLNRQRLSFEINLAPLTKADVDAMLRAIFNLERPVRYEFLNAIYTLTEGNPFFVEEVLKSLIAAGDIFYTPGGWDRKPIDALRIPHSIQTAVQRRTEGLSPAAQQLLTLAAVAGRRFDFALLQHLTNDDEPALLALIEELIAAQLVAEESADRFVFRHALTRQAIYTNLLVRERRRKHHSIVEALEHLYPEGEGRDSRLTDLAYHAYHATDWEKALTYSRQAGEQAKRLYALNAAVEQFSRALEAAQQLKQPPSITLLWARSNAYQAIGLFDPARTDLETALAATRAEGDNRLVWEITLELGFVWLSRDYEQAGDYFRQALDLARTLDDPAILAHSLNRLGNYLTNIDHPVEALPYHQEALSIFEQIQDGNGLAETLDLLGTTLVAGGDWLEGSARYKQAAARFQELDNRQGLASCLTMLTFRGGAYLNETTVIAALFDEAVQDGETALDLARQTGQRAAESVAASTLAFCLGLQGHYARALKLAQSGLTAAGEIEHLHWTTFAHLALGALYLDILATERAREHLEEALTQAEKISSRFFYNLASGYLVTAYAMARDFARAKAVLMASGLKSGVSDQESLSTSRRQLWQGQIMLALAQDDAKTALNLTDYLIATAPNMDPSVVIPRLWHLRGEALLGLKKLSLAENTFLDALQQANEQGFRHLQWRIHSSLARLYQLRRRRPQAEAALETARALIAQLAANLPDESLRQTFTARARRRLPKLAPLTSRRTAKRAYDGLTRREREVAALIAQGMSNRDIAETLVVSERTAATHVGNILSKLGFNSRSQIAAWAVEKGLAQ